MTEKSVLNIILAFVSLVQERNVAEPIYYPNINGKPYTAIQTNESAIIAVQRQLEDNPLSGVFLVCSEKVKTFDAPKTDEYGMVTHINFLKKRLIQADSRLSDKLIELNYYDDLDNIEESMRNVTEIAGSIMSYAQEHPAAKIRLYADMTGGFRYNSAMMLAIMQLLQFNGIELGKVLYSDPAKKRVFDATSLLGLFQLISGADEFIRFGSVETLQDYFHDAPKTQDLDNLLQSMQRFSDAIKMCRTSIIKDELRTLNVYLQAFKENHGNTLQENLFASIIMTLQNEYGALLEGHATEFDIIHWCERKGFLQQAMTLCTEWLPAYLVKHKIAYTEDPGIILECEQEGRKTGRSWQQYFLTVYNRVSVKNEMDSTKPMSLADLLKASILSATSVNKTIETIDVAKYPRLSAFFQELKNVDYDFIFVKSKKMKYQAFENQYPMVGKVFQLIYNQNCRNTNFRRSFTDYLMNTTLEKSLNSLATLSPAALYELFEIPENDYTDEKTDNGQPEIFLSNEEKWDRLTNRYRSLYKSGQLKSALRYDSMLACLKEYFFIRVERNQINHANTEDITTITEIREMISNTLSHWANLDK